MQMSHPEMQVSVKNAPPHVLPSPPSEFACPKPSRIHPTAEQTQIELEQWEHKHKDNAEIGREYERYIGYLCEMHGYRVTYFGALKGKQDMGRDLIVEKGKDIYIVQCKYWGKDKLIHEKHIAQLYGTTVVKAKQDPEHRYRGVFVTNIQLSDTAKEFVRYSNIMVYEGVKMGERPLIKCNINKSGEKIYHLPFEQGYDIIRIIGKRGCFYAWTAVEAEQKGFRRAYHVTNQKQEPAISAQEHACEVSEMPDQKDDWINFWQKQAARETPERQMFMEEVLDRYLELYPDEDTRAK